MRNRSLRQLASVLTALVLLIAIPPRLPAAEADELKLLREQIRALEQQLLVLERKQEIKDEAAAAAAPTTPKITINDKGFTFASADVANAIRLRALIQFDSRLFTDDSIAVNNTYVLRRARLFFEGTLGKVVSYQIVPELAGGTATGATTPSILDANFSFSVRKELQLKFGKFKSPVGLEMLQSEQTTAFNERSLATNLVPNRDIGVLATGEILGGTTTYTVGVLNGVADGASSTNADYDNEKDFVARVFATPFKNSADSLLQGLSFGIAGSSGRQKTASGRTAGYRTDGQQTFFTYNAAVVADGQSWRVSPQLDYRSGSFGLLGEYVLSTVNLRPSATGPKAELHNKAWQIAAGYVLTGEDSSYNGLTPAHNLNFANGSWGAVEVTARYASLKIDDVAFPIYASPASSASGATAYGLGLNWYLAKSTMLKFDYFQTQFDFAPGTPAAPTNTILRQDEQVFITRFQLSF